MFYKAIFILLVTTTSLSANEYDTWAGNVVKKVNTSFLKIMIQGNMINSAGKIVFEVKDNGEIGNNMKIDCVGDLSFCGSITDSLKLAIPFKSPPQKGLAEKLRTFTVTFEKKNNTKG